MFFDAIRVTIRDKGFVRNKAVSIALGILPDGTKEILGLWIEQTKALNAKLRRAVRTRGYFPGEAPSEEAAMTLLYLVLNHAAEQGKQPPREGAEAKTSSPSSSVTGANSDDENRPRAQNY